ncbi:hypothetical protein FOVG_17802 [Fusarium oxysporum f. sp. pisi HDV247]|uniref:Uncharacterized protein n=1 Tax=Fusarium oxysporum f. sp. pisi HDV247 TaxID=1080344 RepID=W9N9N3_FUSOX|nr:hypothetical protein FOVG_19686 [Fusarium oxysporum f. sp. pisi HDV247]EXA29468.1 hypothetical protein FOVG_19047 [Fusarium oxysporum f. sp. pisi HDV247]EXA30834.1 hypothetical protein FOVG_17802 [Fusarium oxysporum f. sp. pisi HDV247]
MSERSDCERVTPNSKTQHTISKNASKDTPQWIPRLTNIGRENMIAPAAKVDRAKSFAANKEAEYFG